MRRRQEEWNEHITIAHLLSKYLDPSRTFWTSLENKQISALSGFFQKLRGVWRGPADILVVYRHATGIMVVFVELQSRWGLASTAQKQVCLEMLRSGAVWWMARSARAATTALLRLVGTAIKCRLKTLVRHRAVQRLRASKRLMRCKKVGVALPLAREN